MPPLLRVFLAPALLGALACAAHAQEPQSLKDRIDNPDLSRSYAPADRQFNAGSSVSDKKASVKSFAFNHSAYLRDGYRTTSYNGTRDFGSKSYAGAKDAAAGKKSFGENDRSFATRDAAGIRDARDANKSLAVREYSNSHPAYAPNGKSQAQIDSLMGDKNLTVDQVRDILNKNK